MKENEVTKIELLRKRLGMSRYRLSQLSGVSPTHIKALETGISPIDGMSVKTVKNLAKALNVHYTELID